MHVMESLIKVKLTLFVLIHDVKFWAICKIQWNENALKYKVHLYVEVFHVICVTDVIGNTARNNTNTSKLPPVTMFSRGLETQKNVASRRKPKLYELCTKNFKNVDFQK